MEHDRGAFGGSSVGPRSGQPCLCRKREGGEGTHQLLTTKELPPLLTQIQSPDSNFPPLLIDLDATPESSSNDLMSKANAKDLETWVTSGKLGDVGDERGDPGDGEVGGGSCSARGQRGG